MIKHPEYNDYEDEWEKYRLILKGGQDFKDEYLERYSAYEPNFVTRKKLTPVPGYAKAALMEIRNAIARRIDYIIRECPSKMYNSCVAGEQFGVDYKGSEMNSFILDKVLLELLGMGKVGIFVDAPSQLEGATASDVAGLHPFLSIVKAEDIYSWKYERNQLTAIAFKQIVYVGDDMPEAKEEQIIKITLGKGIEVLNAEDALIRTVPLEIAQIPFVILELNQSLLADVADYQIAALQFESNDVMFGYKYNFNTLVEQVSANMEALRLLKSASEQNADVILPKEVKAVGSETSKNYSQGMERPSYVNPSPEPMRVSMEKLTSIKETIAQLMGLSIGNIRPKFQSSAAKKMEDGSLEGALGIIGSILQGAERQIAAIWHSYEGTDDASVRIEYPTRYEFKSATEVLTEVNELKTLALSVNSLEFKKQTVKRIAQLMYEGLLDSATFATMINEINVSMVPLIDYTSVVGQVEAGLITSEFGNTLLGYPAGEAEKAKAEHLERIKRIAETQGVTSKAGDPSDRGVKDLQGKKKNER